MKPEEASTQIAEVPASMSIFTRQEPLCDELKDRLFTNEKAGFQYINHPLYCCCLHHDGLNALANRALAEKKRLVEEYKRDGMWRQIVTCLFEKPFRVMMLRAFRRQMEPNDYWKALADVWTSVENLWQHKDDLPILFQDPPCIPIRPMFEDDDWVDFEQLPGQITIYRGCAQRNRRGWSYTLDREKACWFARRYDEPKPILLTWTIPKNLALFYTNARNEREIVINPRSVTGFTGSKPKALLLASSSRKERLQPVPQSSEEDLATG